MREAASGSGRWIEGVLVFGGSFIWDNCGGIVSRAFVKDDAPGEPPIVPPRASLPDGVANYVTPRGMSLLREERVALETERAGIHASHLDESEKQRQLTVIAARLALLMERIATANVVRPSGLAPEAVRFGTVVSIRTGRDEDRTIQIVGVDEANVHENRVAFVSPIAKALTGRKSGDVVAFQTPNGEESLTITSITNTPTKRKT